MTNRPCIVVKCPECGDQRVSPDAVTVRCCVDDGGGWSYRFACPSCGRRAVGESLVSALMDAIDSGAGFESWSSADVEEGRDAPPFTAAQEVELHLLLLEPDWFDELRRCTDLDRER
jgi:predicted RNA-binding Zn-ribbon protein involved in translation (DUF1610 family)